jgi:hypothetical protein
MRVAFLVIVLYLSFWVVGMFIRSFLSWVYLMIRLAFYAAIVGAGLYTYNRGVDGTLSDLEDLTNYWSGQFEMYQRQAQAAGQFNLPFGQQTGSRGSGFNKKRRNQWG